MNSTILSEVNDENKAKCSAFCMFISAWLFILYLITVIIMSWIMRSYIYMHLKQFLHIDSIYDLNLQTSQNSNNAYINPSAITYDLSKKRPYPFEINLKPLDDNNDEYDMKIKSQIHYEQTDQAFLEQNPFVKNLKPLENLDVKIKSQLTHDFTDSNILEQKLPKINLKPLENIDDVNIESQINHEQTDHTLLDQNVPDRLDNEEQIMDSSSIIEMDAISDIISNMSDSILNDLDRLDNEEQLMDYSPIMEMDALSDIISNMSDFILNELEMVEESLKHDVEKFGVGTTNEIDLFADDIISNITNILEEELKIVENSIKSHIPDNKEFQDNTYADSSSGFMGFLSDIFGQHNVRHEAIDKSNVIEGRQFSPRLEHRFDLQEPKPEPNYDHNYLESSENIVLSKAVSSIRNLFDKDKNKSPGVVKVQLKPEDQHLLFKVMLLEYLEIFGLVLFIMSFFTGILFLIISRIISVMDQRDFVKLYNLEESIIPNGNDKHVI